MDLLPRFRTVLPLDRAAGAALLAAFIIVALGGWQLMWGREATLRNAETNIRALSKTLAQHAARTIESVDLTLGGAVAQVESRNAPATVVKGLQVEGLAQVRNIVVVGATGDWIADTAPVHRSFNSADRPYFTWHRDHADRGVHIEPAMIGRTSGKLGIPVSRRIDNPDGSFGGLVVAALAPEYFGAFYEKVRMGEHGTIALWTQDGAMLVRYPVLSTERGSRASSSLTQAAAVFAAGSGFERSRSPWDGIERIFAFEQVDKYPLVVSAAISVDDALASWNQQALTQAAIVGAAALLLVILAIALERHRRRTRLLEAAAEADRCVLKESESRYRLLAQTSADMIQQLDLSGKRQYVSPASLDIFGTAPVQMIGTHPIDFIHPDDSLRVGGLIHDLAEGRMSRARSIHRIRHADGHWVWVEGQFRLIRSAGTGAPLEIVSSVRDVTERVGFKQKLEHSNRLLTMAEEIAEVGHWRLELPDRLMWSDQVYRIHGRDPATFSPTVEAAIDLYHPADRAEVNRCVADAVAAQQGFEFALRVLRPDGEVRNVLSRGICEVGASGEIIAVFGTIMDVTELRRAETAAVESEARYRLLADNATDMISHMDLSGRRLFVSPASLDLLGYPPDDLIRTSPQDMIHPDDAPKLEAVFADLAAGRIDRAINVNRLRHRDGRWIWVEASLKLIVDPDGHPAGFIGAIRNIEDRKRADDALRASEARYRILAETTSDVITQLGLDLKRQYVSPSCRRVFGFEPEEMIGTSPWTTIHPDDVSKVVDLETRLAAGEIESDRAVTTYRTFHRQGYWFWIEAVLNLVRDFETGVPSSIICSLRDVTERQRAARHLERAKTAAEQIARAKAEFVANMSHELRTPLTAILGVNDLLEGDAKLTDVQRHLVSLSAHAGRSLLTIVNDVLDFSKIEAGQLSIEILPFSARELVESCRDLTSQGLKGKPVDIRTNFAEDPGWLVGDSSRLRQVLLNLLTNAVKFTSAGHVDIDVGYTMETGLLRVEVSDTGIGIPEAKLSALFERFSQADASITRRYGGSGLGLAICKRLMDLMSGSIGVRSVEGEGSTFWFELHLPRAALQAVESAVSDLAARPRPRWSILLAEDNAINQEIIGTVLREQQHSVNVVPDGAAALEAVRSGTSVDIILMDLQMPVMDGLTASAAIRKVEAALGSPPVPIIGLTANALSEDVERCLAAGMNAHIAKPIEWHALFKTMDGLLASSRVDRAEASVEALAGVLDATKLEELAEIIGPARLADILKRFVDDLARRIAAIELASAEELSTHMHSLIAQAGQLGFQQLSNLCAVIDGGLRDGGGPHRIEDIRAAAERALSAARSFQFSKVA